MDFESDDFLLIIDRSEVISHNYIWIIYHIKWYSIILSSDILAIFFIKEIFFNFVKISFSIPSIIEASFFELCKNDEFAKTLLYIEIP